jgi:uncharacterized protein YdeI (YjbR/CyaY-like superfamily)
VVKYFVQSKKAIAKFFALIFCKNVLSHGYLCPHSAGEWRRWLEKNGAAKREIWLLFPHKNSNLAGITYLEALEEALCFGWIDGMVKRYDENHVSSRFSPRANGSSWSEVNKQHVRLLIAAGKMTPAGSTVLPDLNPTAFPMPEDILDVLRSDEVTWKNFCAFPDYYKNIRLAAIDRMRSQPEKFHKALNFFLKKTRANGRYGRFR